MNDAPTSDSGIGDVSGIRSSVSLDKDWKRFLSDIINRIDGLRAIIITDRDGVPVIQVSADSDYPSSFSKQSFLSAVNLAIDQAGKIGMGKNKKIISIFTNYQVVHFNRCPVIVTLVASTSANTGLLLNVGTELAPFTNQLGAVVEAVC